MLSFFESAASLLNSVSSCLEVKIGLIAEERPFCLEKSALFTLLQKLF